MTTTAFVDGSTLTAAAWFNDVDTASYAHLTSPSGTNTVAATGPASMTAYAAGQRFTFIPANTNTGATTLNITPSGSSALGAKNVFNGNAACVGGEIVASVPCTVIYDGTQFQIVNPAVTYGTKATTLTWDGSGGTSGSITLTMQKQGRFVLLKVPAVSATTGTSSTTLTSNTAIDAAFRPTTQQWIAIIGIVNNGAVVGPGGVLVVNTDGTIQIARDGAATAFTDAAAAGTTKMIAVVYSIE